MAENRPVSCDVGPSLKEMVQGAAAALSRLDLRRLEEIGLQCSGMETLQVNPSEAREVETEMTMLARLLEMTRLNASLMERLRSMRAGNLEYMERSR